MATDVVGDGGDQRGLTRRQGLRRLGFGAAAVAAGPAFLAACGSSSKKSSTSATTAGGGGSSSAGDVGTQLAKLLNIDKATAGAGMTFQMGNVLALTGNGSFYGKTCRGAPTWP
jgi:hypothetical protein